MRFILIILMLSLTMWGYAGDMKFTKKASGKPELIQSGPEKMWCPICGMNLKMFYKTSHALKLSGGHNKQYCSIRCMLQDYEGLSSIVKEILVVDAASEKLIPVSKAMYVVGSSAPGTMTKISKIAFANMKEAEAFQKKMGGKIMNFNEAAESAKKTMQNDVHMTSMKRQKMMYPKGEKIFKSVCDQSINPMKYNLINEMKGDIKNNKMCGELKEKELQAVALYLWDVVRMETSSDLFIEVKEGEKCPVCGMFVHKYPKWAAKVTYDKGSHSVFDGVKDMMKFYFNPAKWGFDGIKIDNAFVTDYYSNKAVQADKAYYVIGSDVYGPMGKELIPFNSEKNAQTFMSDHSGKEVLTFDKITEEMVYKLDE